MTESRIANRESRQDSQPRVLIVTGPTASGKTALGIELAKRFNGAIISADSRMVYCGLDIGTGKPTWECRQLDHSPWIEPQQSRFGPIYTIEGVDHYGLDLVEPEVGFPLTDWLAFARPLIADLEDRSLQPIVVGGTGLYLKALTDGYLPPPTDPGTRMAIEAMTTDQIRAELEMRDPKTANREPTNRRRLVRALEVVRLTGKPIGDSRTARLVERWAIVGLDRSNAELFERIDRRVDDRLARGMVEEVQDLIAEVAEGHERTERVEWLHSLGLEYRLITEWLQSGSADRRKLAAELKSAIHAYARRQLTYLRNQLSVHWITSVDEAFEGFPLASSF